MNGVRVNTVDIGGPYSHVDRPVAREPQEDLHLRPPERRSPEHVCEAHRHRASPGARSAGRSPPAKWTRSSRSCTRRRSRKARSKKGWRSGSRRSWCRRTSSSAWSAIGGRCRPRRISQPISQHELATRLSYFLWASMPDAELRRAADTGTLRDPVVLRRAGAAHAAGSEGARPGGELRRPVAAVPRARIDHARSRALPRLRGLPPALDAPRDGAVLRAHRPRRPQHPRLHRRPVFVHQRAARAALRDSERLGPGVPARRPDRYAARRRADPGQRPHRLVVCDADVAGAAGQVGPRQPPRTRRPTIRRPTCRTSKSRRSGRRRRCGSSCRRTARTRPARRATAGWIRSGSASRISTPSGRGVQWTGNSRSTRPARCRTAKTSRARSSCGRFSRASVKRSRGRLTAKLLTYALGRGLERYDRRPCGPSRAGCPRATTSSRAWFWRSSTACRSCRAGRWRRGPRIERRDGPRETADRHGSGEPRERVSERPQGVDASN